MLSVSPPLHQDFRARQMLCSPGDGWRAYVPPPMPVVAPAFHFLASLLEPGAYATATSPSAKSSRRPMPAHLNGTLAAALERFPCEVLDQIVADVVRSGSGHALASSSRAFHNLAMPHLYRKVVLRTNDKVTLLTRTLATRPNLGQYIRALHLEPHRLVWDDVHRLVDLLGPCTVARVHTLALRIPASELPLAVPLLAAFAPTTFEWVTSPCWQMRPAQLFVAFLTRWAPTLRYLCLESFRFDDTLATCVQSLPQLECLSIRGSGSEHIQADVLIGLLKAMQQGREYGEVPTLEIAGCLYETG